MSSQASNSESNSESNSFDLLHPSIQRWIWNEGWETLRDVQEKSIPHVLSGTEDVVITASTASGKTEAAFLPIISAMLEYEDCGCVLYISPLKALINDQFKRMDSLCSIVDIPVYSWHGDVDFSKKGKFFKNPKGIVLITPESIEAMLVNRGSQIARLYSTLRYIVIDEMHAFIGTERGRQLQSIMARIEAEAGGKVPRIGLSATLGDMAEAAKFLRPNENNMPTIIEGCGNNNDIWIKIKGFYDKETEDPVAETTTGQRAIIEDLFSCLTGTNNLVFPNGRNKVELYANQLRKLCSKNSIPNEYWAHHGSLSKTLREETEAALKDINRPCTAICTTTLELGIDIGHIDSVTQIGTPPSVASLRQRLGRSGRREGAPSILRGYVIEKTSGPTMTVSDMLREDLLGLCASINLLLKGWYEPPKANGLHLSTMVQQTLSLIAQHSGITPAKLWHVLVKKGPFWMVDAEMFKEFLLGLKEKDLVYQDPDGMILPTLNAERYINNYEFYTAFKTEDEYTLIHEGKELGSMPMERPLQKGETITFASRSWKATGCSATQRLIYVEPTNRSMPPIFTGSGISLHDEIRKEMRRILESAEVYAYLDDTAKKMLAEAREAYMTFGLDKNKVIPTKNGLAWFTWAGDAINDTLALILGANGMTVSNQGVCLGISELESEVELLDLLNKIGTTVSIEELTVQTDLLEKEKWDNALPYNLLQKTYASSNLDINGALACITRLLEE